LTRSLPLSNGASIKDVCRVFEYVWPYIIETTAVLFALSLSNNQHGQTISQTRALPSHALNTMFTTIFSADSYVPTPRDPTRPSDPNRSLLDSLDAKRTALSKYQMPCYRKLPGLRAKGWEKETDLHALATGYGHLSTALTCTMKPRISQTEFAKDFEGIRTHLDNVDLSRYYFNRRPTVHSDVAREVRIFDHYRDEVFSAAVTYLSENEKGGNEITPCLQKARDFCTLGSGFRGTWTMAFMMMR
jgi:hypothetical protein